MDIVLFTNFFPYKKAEPFLINEFKFTQKSSRTVSVFTLYGDKRDNCIPPLPQVTFFEPVLTEFGDKKSLFLKGLFNFSPCSFHLKELFNKQILFSLKKQYWLFVSLLITRAALSSKAHQQLTKTLKESKNTVLYFYWGDNLCWMIPYLKRSIGHRCKIVVRMHGSELYENIRDNYAPIRQQVLECADLILTVSENGKSYLSTKYPTYRDKIFVSRLGVFDNGLNPFKKEAVYHLVSVSNLVTLKRVDLIFQTLQKVNLPLVWHHFGDGPLRGELNELIKSSRKGLEVKMHGFVDNPSLMSFYKSQSIDLFINLSTSEGLPVSVMEALSFGIPVMATDVGGTSELVDNQVGQLVKVDLPLDELATCIESHLTASPENMALWRQNARNSFEEKVSAEKNYTAFYKKLSALFA